MPDSEPVSVEEPISEPVPEEKAVPNRRPVLIGLLGIAAAGAAFASFGFGGEPPAQPKAKSQRVVAIEGSDATPKPMPRTARAPLVKKVQPAHKPGVAHPLPAGALTGVGKAHVVMTPAQEQAAIQRKYDDLSRFMMMKDGPHLSQLFRALTPPEFSYTDIHKKRFTRDELIAQISHQMAIVKRVSLATNRVASWSSANGVGKAKVVSGYKMVFATKAKNGKTTASVLQGESMSLDTWVKSRTGWKLKSVVSLKDSAKLNGKPL